MTTDVFTSLAEFVGGAPLAMVRVFGQPVPGGSKTAFALRGAGGQILLRKGPSGKTSPILAYRDDAKGNGRWKRTVRDTAALAWPREPLKGPLFATAVFLMPRPKGHLGARGLRPSAPMDHTTKPDATKLWRAVEDALTGVLWVDDAQLIGHVVMKAYTLHEPCVIVKVYRALTPAPDAVKGAPCSC